MKLRAKLCKRRKASILTLDIKGGFDTVLPSRLLHRLVDQGWPQQVRAWISSFLSGWQAEIRLDGTIGSQFVLQGSLPQGSLVLPNLLMLSMQPLFGALNLTPEHSTHLLLTCRGYADDGCLMASSHSLTNNTTILENCFAGVLLWRRVENIPIKPTELMHFPALELPKTFRSPSHKLAQTCLASLCQYPCEEYYAG